MAHIKNSIAKTNHCGLQISATEDQNLDLVVEKNYLLALYRLRGNHHRNVSGLLQQPSKSLRFFRLTFQ